MCNKVVIRAGGEYTSVHDSFLIGYAGGEVTDEDCIEAEGRRDIVVGS